MAVSPVVVAGSGDKGQTSDHLLIRFIDVTFDNSYPTGGEALDFTKLGFTTVYAVTDCGGINHLGYVFAYDYTNSKILAYRNKDPANAGGADIAFPEVTNTADLSLVTVRFAVMGV